MRYGADDLRRLSGLLDEALQLDGPERESWLDGLSGDAAGFRPALRKMLAREASDEADRLLARMPTFTAPGVEPRATAFKPGDTVGPYRLLRPIGHGGMGEVWLAERSDGQLKRGVALKLPVLSVRRSVLAQRFERERDILGALVHPNIARLYDAGLAEDGQPFMALEYVEGTPITKAADDKALDAKARVRLLRQVMDAVQYAHANLVIHRDLKPDNVLVTAQGNAKLLDFGIAKLVEEETSTAAETELTRLGGRALTLHYAAPEQVSGEPINTATDVWALGVLLYELLTGMRPFNGKGRGTLEREVMESEPARPSQRKAGAIRRLSRSLAADLDTIVMKALKKPPAERYATVSSFAHDLDRWLQGEPVLAQPDSPWYRTRKFVARHKLAVGAATLAVIALISTASIAVLFGFRAREESARAIAARDFMVEMFRRTDPDQSPGKEVSARQLLIQGYDAVLATMQGQPLLQSDLLAGLGSALSGMEEFHTADNAYMQAALRYRETNRPREAAAVILDRAEMRMAAQWQVREVAGLLAEAERAYPAGMQDDRFVVRYSADRAFAAYLDGNTDAVRSGLDRALLHAERALRDTSSRTVFTIRVLAGLEGQFGAYPPAIDRLTALLARLREQKSVPPSDVLGVQGDIAVMENLAGRYRASLAQFDAASAFCQRSLSNQCIYATQYQRSRVLLTLGHEQRALDAVPFLLARAEADRGPRGWETVFVVNAYEILARNGELARHPGVTARVRAIGESTEEVPRSARVHALVAQTRMLLLDGRPQQAKEMSDRTQAALSALGLADDRTAIRAHLMHGMTFHALGQHEAAMKVMDRTYAAQAGFSGAAHPATQLVSVHRARVLWALNRPAEALQVLDQAIPVLEEAMGPDAPSLIRLAALRKELSATRPESLAAMRKVDLFM